MMKILVLNGSPKGEMSVTMQYVAYLGAVYPDHTFTIVHAARSCPRFEKNEEAFREVLDQVADADMILWAYPLYYLLVHSGYKRFIELVFERTGGAAFKGKYAALISTSIHFYDHTAAAYIRAVSEDLGMAFIDSYPAHMKELMSEEGRRSLTLWFERVEEYIREKRTPHRESMPPRFSSFSYSPSSAEEGEKRLPAETGGPEIPKTVIVADLENGSGNIAVMVERARRMVPDARLIDLAALKMGPCLGCLRCGFDNICAYEGKDDFIDIYRHHILTADIILFAGTIHDRYLSYRWQRYLERTFCMTHQPVLKNKHAAFLISGPLSQNHNISEVIRGWAETMGLTLTGIVSDECSGSAELDRKIDSLVCDCLSCSRMSLHPPVTFRGVAGMKLFRDEIHSDLRWVFQADHRSYRRNGIYDFPNKHVLRKLVLSLMITVTAPRRIRSRIRMMLKKGMVRPYRKIIDNVHRAA